MAMWSTPCTRWAELALVGVALAGLIACAGAPLRDEIHGDAEVEAALAAWTESGRQVVPESELGEHALIGKASWYGPGFQGNSTASGEAYDMYGMTAAHKTLPFGSLVRVWRPSSRQFVVVRINDRGPFVKGRVIDLSYGAATDLGMVRAGVVEVELEVLALGSGRRRGR